MSLPNCREAVSAAEFSVRRDRSRPLALRLSYGRDPPSGFSWLDGQKALRDFVAVPQSFFSLQSLQSVAVVVQRNISAAFVDFHFNTNGLS